MQQLVATAARYAFLISITVAAAAAMWWLSVRGDSAKAKLAVAAPPSEAAQSKSLVSVTSVKPELVEITVRFSGKVRPWETYTLGFEQAGRVDKLGENAAGDPLDDGDAVERGQVLASLDDVVLRARRAEAVAQLEKAESDMRRARNLRERGGQAITDAEYQVYVTDFALAKAQYAVAVKNLEDAVLMSPVTGRVSRRLVEPGESIGANEPVFEVVENHEVLLLLDVPEARVRELDARQREVAEANKQDPTGDEVFRARVHLEGRDLYGRQATTIDAEVYRIAQVADARTGLFEVEVRIPNEEGRLRPGMVATADIVTGSIRAYRVPESAVTFRGDEAFLFAVEEESAPVDAFYFRVGQTTVHRAKKTPLTSWIDQGDELVIPADACRLDAVVVRGHQRLTDGQLARLVQPGTLGAPSAVTARGAGADNPGVN